MRGPRSGLTSHFPAADWDGIGHQRAEILLVGGQFYQEPPHLVHVGGIGGPQLS